MVFHVSSSNLLCMLLITSSRTSSIMAGKKIKMADLLSFFAFYVNKFNNGGGLLLSVLLFNLLLSG